MKITEIKAELKEIKRVDSENRHYYLSCAYEGELQYELDGKGYKVISQATDPDLRSDRILIDIYPSILKHHDKKIAPDYIFEQVEYAQEANKEMALFTAPRSIEKTKDITPNFQLPEPQLVLSVAFKTVYAYMYNKEICAIEHDEIIKFLVDEI